MYMPLLMTEMTERVEKVLFYRYVLDRMIREVVDNSKDVFDALDAWEMAGRPGRERKQPDEQDKIKVRFHFQFLTQTFCATNHTNSVSCSLLPRHMFCWN